MIRRGLQVIANTQYGYFTAQQAQNAGYSTKHHSYHVKAGNWQAVSRGVYRLPGYEDTLESEFVRWTFWALGMSKGRTAVVSHESALYYYGLTRRAPDQVHFSVPLQQRNKSELGGCLFHREDLAFSEVVTRSGFQITTPLRTLRDMKPDLVLREEWGSTLRLAFQLGYLERRAVLDLAGYTPDWLLGTGDKAEMSCGMTAVDQISALAASGGEQMKVYRGITLQSMPYRRGSPVNRSFTLIEMLVVISVIGILAALLLPALQKSIASAQGVSCVNNLKQLGVGVSTYCDEFRNQFATMDASIGMSWKMFYSEGSSYNYYGSGVLQSLDYWFCPVTPSRSSEYIYGGMKPYGVSSTTYGTAYANSGASGTMYFLPMNGFKSPSATVLAGDAVVWWGSFTGPYRRLYKDGVGFAHAGCTTGMLYADGHSSQATVQNLIGGSSLAGHFSFGTVTSKTTFAAGYDTLTGQRLF